MLPTVAVRTGELLAAVLAAGAMCLAVTTAREAGAPTGDLDALCRRLRSAAADADRSLSMLGRAPAAGGGLGPVSSEVGELVMVAGLIHDAAASAVASMSRPASRSLAEDAHREAAALSAGTASAARAAAGGLPREPA